MNLFLNSGKTIILENENQTRKLAEELAERCLKIKMNGSAIVIGITGDLGSGKTFFTQTFAKTLGIKERITSPTFAIQKIYKIPIVGLNDLIHIDTYRIEDEKEILDLGWEKLIGNPKNIIIIEWAEKIKEIIPNKYIQINFEYFGKNKRKATVKHFNKAENNETT